MRTKNKIIKCAQSAREWADGHARYHTIFNSSLQGMCAITSAYLFELLIQAGLKAKIAYNDNHCFILTNGYLVDVTASQFPDIKEKICIQKYNQLQCPPRYWRISKKFNSVLELQMYQQEHFWPNYQIVK
jgi:hypothetical protein